MNAIQLPKARADVNVGLERGLEALSTEITLIEVGQAIRTRGFTPPRGHHATLL